MKRKLYSNIGFLGSKVGVCTVKPTGASVYVSAVWATGFECCVQIFESSGRGVSNSQVRVSVW